MPTARQHMASSVVDGKLYVIGGRPTGKSSNINTNEVFDPKSNSWASIASMPTERGGIAAATVNGEIYVFGGEAPDNTFNTVEKYSPQKHVDGRRTYAHTTSWASRSFYGQQYLCDWWGAYTRHIVCKR